MRVVWGWSGGGIGVGLGWVGVLMVVWGGVGWNHGGRCAVTGRVGHALPSSNMLDDLTFGGGVGVAVRGWF